MVLALYNEMTTAIATKLIKTGIDRSISKFIRKRIELITDTLASDKKILVNPRATEPLTRNTKNKNAQTVTAETSDRCIAYANEEEITNLGAIIMAGLMHLSKVSFGPRFMELP